jgi:ring-1,2-phenylacetyl-CoA epoxidase subunit PaaC
MRDEHEFRNLLLLEQPNGHFGDALVRQFLFEAFYLHQLEALTRCSDQGLHDIAMRALKEVKYHFRHSSQWMVRLGDGTDLSHERAQQSLDDAWRYTGEMFVADEIDVQFQECFCGPDLCAIQSLWQADIECVISEATLKLPDAQWMASGGKQGQHSEQLGFMLAEMQYLQRSFPGATW